LIWFLFFLTIKLYLNITIFFFIRDDKNFHKKDSPSNQNAPIRKESPNNQAKKPSFHKQSSPKSANSNGSNSTGLSS
jgi:hypothetical protein